MRFHRPRCTRIPIEAILRDDLVPGSTARLCTLCCVRCLSTVHCPRFAVHSLPSSSCFAAVLLDATLSLIPRSIYGHWIHRSVHGMMSLLSDVVISFFLFWTGQVRYMTALLCMANAQLLNNYPLHIYVCIICNKLSELSNINSIYSVQLS